MREYNFTLSEQRIMMDSVINQLLYSTQKHDPDNENIIARYHVQHS